MPERKVFNHSSQKHIRQKLRKSMPAPERRLWMKIQNSQLGAKFRRQHGIGPYIVDFYSPEIKLVIELDGESHFATQAIHNDKIRDHYMKSLGLKILRFSNRQVMEELNSVLEVLRHNIPPL